MDSKSEEAKRQYDLADERMERIFDEALVEIERLKAESEQLKERLEDVYLKDTGKTKEINILTKENTKLHKALEDAIQLAKELLPYKSDYLVDKHDDRGELVRLEEALKDSNGA